jgi:hypothetical protein
VGRVWRPARRRAGAGESVSSFPPLTRWASSHGRASPVQASNAGNSPGRLQSGALLRQMHVSRRTCHRQVAPHAESSLAGIFPSHRTLAVSGRVSVCAVRLMSCRTPSAQGTSMTRISIWRLRLVFHERRHKNQGFPRKMRVGSRR